jgi:hypothetical protein
MREGLNSPAFITHVLSLNNLRVEKRNGEPDSAALRAATDEVHDSPQPGDLMFFQGTEAGSTGEYVMMYLGQGDDRSGDVCLGVMGVKYPFGVYGAKWLQDPPHPDKFKEYRRPHYRD